MFNLILRFLNTVCCSSFVYILSCIIILYPTSKVAQTYLYVFSGTEILFVNTLLRYNLH